jgi:hypothetical protein
MADERAEDDARARGDVTRGALATLAGACVGGAIGLRVIAPAKIAAVAAFAHDAFAASGTPETALRRLFGIVASAALPVALFAAAGALAVGMAQTRGFLARPGVADPPDAPSPPVALALLGWLALAALAFDGVRAIFGLASVAPATAIAGGAAELVVQLARVLLLGVAMLALIDHLLRARRRQARLGAGPIERARLPVVEGPVPEELLAGAERVLYDGERVVIVSGRRVALARVSGLVAQAVLELARRRGLPVRPAAPTVLATLPLGRQLDDEILGREPVAGDGA